MIRERATVACLSCNYSPLPYYTGRAETVVCPGCGKELLVSNGQSFQSRVPRKEYQAEKYTIPLGTELHIHKVDYAVVGVAVMKEAGKTYSWTEYTLFNGQLGFRTLSEYENTFMLVEEFVPQEAEVTGAELVCDNTAYKIYNSYKINVLYAAGEFSYHPSEIHGVQANEYLFLHKLLIVKDIVTSTPHTKLYFRAEHVSKKIIEKALGTYLVSGNYVNPTTYYLKAFTPREAFLGYAGFLALLVLSLVFFQTLRPEKKVWSYSTMLTNDSLTRSQPVISPTFRIDEPYTALRFDFVTDVRNNWIELGFNLVNEGNNKTYAFASGAEYYTGIDWTEGDPKNYATLAGIPSGNYHIALQPVFNTGSSSVRLDLEVYKNHTYLRNYIFFAILAGLFPLTFYIMERIKDRNRWYYSDYSPYTYAEDEE
ncbi:MAG: DUF4178 domain-containing protein [Flavobacteriales bacterium]